MNRASLLALVIFVAGMLLTPAHTQEMPKKDATPKPALSPSEGVLQQWNDIGRKLIAIAENFPEDKYDFKPTPAVRSFAERLIHAGHANQFFIKYAVKRGSSSGPNGLGITNFPRPKPARAV